ncbi:hypothetical protein NPIL_296601 [Nephila pilipes]|uniref:Uncharacterized protein n=1 Tax=Nephila pilipes TaxID=299642 RepID=A0A8X6UCL9_NEPPI|nr:hypothetical protein NPIL_296601 [Nephila pilipes]
MFQRFKCDVRIGIKRLREKFISNLSDKNDLAEILKNIVLFYDDSESENVDSEELETQVQDEGKEDSDIVASKNIE